jgi:hypothetical protein
VKSCPDSRFVTCGLRCAEKLCWRGADPTMCDVSKTPRLSSTQAELGYHSIATAVRGSKGTSNVEIPVASKPHLPVSCVRAGRNIKVIICVARYASKSLSNVHPFSWRFHHTTPRTRWVRISVIPMLFLITDVIPLKAANKFEHAWKFPNTRKPKIKRIFKIIENKSFLQPYDRYKSVVTLPTKFPKIISDDRLLYEY